MQGKRARMKEQLFFDHCAERMMELPPKIRSTLQMQIMQLFYNAENVDEGISVPLVPLHPQPQMQVGNFQPCNYTPSLTSSDDSRPTTPHPPPTPVPAFLPSTATGNSLLMQAMAVSDWAI